MTLPPFNEQSKCPKCGYDDIATVYHSCREYRCPAGTWDEHFCRTCRRCGYKWGEGCLPIAPQTQPVSLEADGVITIYNPETSYVLTEYKGLGVHNLVSACLGMHNHPKLEAGSLLGSLHGHIVVDKDDYDKMIAALVSITSKPRHAVKHVKASDFWSHVNRARIRTAF